MESKIGEEGDDDLTRVSNRRVRRVHEVVQQITKSNNTTNHKPSTTYHQNGGGDTEEDHSDLPEWLLLEILARLPIKPIFMFMSVSKRWNSLISTPFFRRYYVSRRTIVSSASSGSLLSWTILSGSGYFFCGKNYWDRVKLDRLCCDDYKFPTVSVMDVPLSVQQKQHRPERPDWCEIKVSCNGLLLCSKADSIDFYVCNPLTRKWVLLPRPSYLFLSAVEGFVTRVEVGIVISYKVVRIQLPVNKKITNMLRMEIFDSETGVWRRQNVNCPRNIGFIGCKKPISFNGILHWFTERPCKIMAYDPYNNIDQCRLIELPPVGGHFSFRANELCGVSQGHLQYIETVGGGYKVWMLENYDSGKWHFKYGIRWDGVKRLPLTLHPFDSDILYLRAHGEGILSYNNRSKTWEFINDIGFSEPLFHLTVSALSFVLPLWPSSVPQHSLEAI